MVASMAWASAFSPVPPSSSSAKRSAALGGGGPDGVNVRGIVAKPVATPTGAMQVKATANAVPKNNGSAGLKTKASKVEDEAASPPPLTLTDWEPMHPDMSAGDSVICNFSEDLKFFRQNFSIRSYEMGPDQTASTVTLISHLMEAAVNHMRMTGLRTGIKVEGYGSTPEMSKRNLVWVITKMRVHVEQYPMWEDIVEVETWVGPCGKNGMRRSWHVRDRRTGQTVMRATSDWFLLNVLTRRPSKIPDEVRAEIGRYFVERAVFLDEDNRKFPKIDDDSADYVRRNLTPHWNDLDINRHVNNLKYTGWIIESTPISILETHELAIMILEYRRECGKNSVVQTLASLSANCSEDGTSNAGIECHHLLRLDSGAELMRGRTEWRPKPGHIPEAIA